MKDKTGSSGDTAATRDCRGRQGQEDLSKVLGRGGPSLPRSVIVSVNLVHLAKRTPFAPANLSGFQLLAWLSIFQMLPQTWGCGAVVYALATRILKEEGRRWARVMALLCLVRQVARITYSISLSPWSPGDGSPSVPL